MKERGGHNIVKGREVDKGKGRTQRRVKDTKDVNGTG